MRPASPTDGVQRPDVVGRGRPVGPLVVGVGHVGAVAAGHEGVVVGEGGPRAGGGVPAGGWGGGARGVSGIEGCNVTRD